MRWVSASYINWQMKVVLAGHVFTLAQVQHWSCCALPPLGILTLTMGFGMADSPEADPRF
jgi:hypothetical protein